MEAEDRGPPGLLRAMVEEAPWGQEEPPPPGRQPPEEQEEHVPFRDSHTQPYPRK